MKHCSVVDGHIQGSNAANGNGDLIVGIGGPAFADADKPGC